MTTDKSTYHSNQVSNVQTKGVLQEKKRKENQANNRTEPNEHNIGATQRRDHGKLQTQITEKQREK